MAPALPVISWEEVARRVTGRCLRSLRLASLLAVAAGGALAQSGRELEWAVKATFLYKFAPFVGWPADAFPSDTAPLRLCVGGTDPFGELLDRSVAGQRVAGRPVEVARLTDLQQVATCRILFAAGSDQMPVADMLRQASGSPVLTVTDAGTVPEGQARGIIHFEIQAGRVRFDIDEAAAAANRLEISSKLLAMALSVRPRPQPGETP
jgi:hypothetical protein